MQRPDDTLFHKFQSYFPFCCVDLILIKNGKFLLVKRSISPYKGKLCLPGGIMRRGEKLEAAVKRIGREELGIDVEIKTSVGFYEKIYPNRHDVTHCFLVITKKGKIHYDYQAKTGKFFKNIPKETAPFFKKMLIDAGFS
ncbi:GDP-mannose mannosyl hydrolase [Nitrosotalea sinensis]|uniref:GDP-mannose mannosyl hydrolase n=1 Tax=Nitrosotalea sinensis TaxID=1499975 RepID=A0A2H1EEB7_9ARCH|nr:NUDIX domain-containing protein [Candidatus Nitrosotalea sinensis]SHO42827.1 GDP-mannose mannosyl hydrolase [Candidatus Nitrosotalea sinensis]